MEVVDAGYKMTEVGQIPEDWIVTKQKDVVKYINGRAYGRHEWETIGTPVVRLQNLTQRGGDFYYSTLNLPPHQYMYNGDLIFMWSASFGPYKWWGNKAIFHYHIWKIECNTDRVYKDFYYYKLLEITEVLKRDTSGSTMLHLTKSGMENYLIGIPSTLTEQKAIATALSDVDALISSLDKLIEKKKAIKQGAMQELLTGKTRLAGFGNGKWREYLLGRIGDTYGGLSGKRKDDFEDGTMPYITFLNVMMNTIVDLEDVGYVTIKPGEQQNIARKGDLFFNTSSETPEEVGMCAVLLDDISELYLNSFCFGFRLKEDAGIDGLFLSYLINSAIGRMLFLSLAQGATRYNLSKKNFSKIIFYAPAVSEQKAIAKVLYDLEKEIQELEIKMHKHKLIKQGMMQELLTGKIRINYG